MAFETSLLSIALRISFFAFPIVSSLAFKALHCDDLDANDELPGPAVMSADFAVACHDEHGDVSDEYDRIRVLAYVAIALYPIGVPLSYTVLFVKARRAIWAEKPTSLSKALDFLVGDYDAAYFFWELVEVLKKLLLVGAMSIVKPGEVNQLVIAFMLTLFFLVMLLVSKPYKRQGDDVVALASGSALTIFFFFSLLLKFQTLIEAVEDVLTVQLARTFTIDAGTTTALLLVSSLGALVLVGAMIIVETAAEGFKTRQTVGAVANAASGAGASGGDGGGESSRGPGSTASSSGTPLGEACGPSALGRGGSAVSSSDASTARPAAAEASSPAQDERASLGTFLHSVGGACSRPDFDLSEPSDVPTAERLPSAAPPAVGTRVQHPNHGAGTVVEHMSDGRTCVAFDSGEEHRYEPKSLHKIINQSSQRGEGELEPSALGDEAISDEERLRRKLAAREARRRSLKAADSLKSLVGDKERPGREVSERRSKQLASKAEKKRPSQPAEPSLSQVTEGAQEEDAAEGSPAASSHAQHGASSSSSMPPDPPADGIGDAPSNVLSDAPGAHWSHQAFTCPGPSALPVAGPSQAQLIPASKRRPKAAQANPSTTSRPKSSLTVAQSKEKETFHV